jgi:hypothetical protein
MSDLKKFSIIELNRIENGNPQNLIDHHMIRCQSLHAILKCRIFLITYINKYCFLPLSDRRILPPSKLNHEAFSTKRRTSNRSDNPLTNGSDPLFFKIKQLIA